MKDATDDLVLTFYGDDFTGSTDVMESLECNSISTVLFLEPPTRSDLAEFPDVRAVGVAGTSRTMTPAEMDEKLPPIFEVLGDLDARICHYKVCSTFDSSPDVGSIGRAIDIGFEVFETPSVPLVVAAPDLHPRGRYVAFGNLFATVDGETFRLDRHPTMKDHPVTPMEESDLRQHLDDQTDKEIGIVELPALEGANDVDPEVAYERAAANPVVLFDTVSSQQQETVGRLVWNECQDAENTTFAVGSSGFEYALTDHLQSIGQIEPPESHTDPGAVDQLLVMSGSASPVTDGQIQWALDRGFEGVRLDTRRLIDPDATAEAREEAFEAALESLRRGADVVVYAARGSDDPAIERTLDRADELGLDGQAIGERLATQQGRLLRELLVETNLSRACVAGGDTSGYVSPELDVYALEMLVPLAPGSPLCRASSREDRLDGLEIALKGGQVGRPNYFGLVKGGGTSPFAD